MIFYLIVLFSKLAKNFSFIGDSLHLFKYLRIKEKDNREFKPRRRFFRSLINKLSKNSYASRVIMAKKIRPSRG
ncbi:hypothetical protein BpHYR1_026467 [Brachionus plicatilis]|uniref:Uncharacterized protein n=1 Tax=Brachionus plicatilis TaxID=10195 RepID=A0A3M7R1Y7_BRAPC|nr:hypothetical protein BpHYR1_026467 [Brachionus plicatilis]